jgi:hypothetical protein
MSENKPNKPEKKTIALTIDMGGSQNKVIAQDYPNGSAKAIILDSEVADQDLRNWHKERAGLCPATR